jgi:hypothetical protein
MQPATHAEFAGRNRQNKRLSTILPPSKRINFSKPDFPELRRRSLVKKMRREDKSKPPPTRLQHTDALHFADY